MQRNKLRKTGVLIRPNMLFGGVEITVTATTDRNRIQVLMLLKYPLNLTFFTSIINHFENN